MRAGDDPAAGPRSGTRKCGIWSRISDPDGHSWLCSGRVEVVADWRLVSERDRGLVEFRRSSRGHRPGAAILHGEGAAFLTAVFTECRGSSHRGPRCRWREPALRRRGSELRVLGQHRARGGDRVLRDAVGGGLHIRQEPCHLHERTCRVWGSRRHHRAGAVRGAGQPLRFQRVDRRCRNRLGPRQRHVRTEHARWERAIWAGAQATRGQLVTVRQNIFPQALSGRRPCGSSTGTEPRHRSRRATTSGTTRAGTPMASRPVPRISSSTRSSATKREATTRCRRARPVFLRTPGTAVRSDCTGRGAARSRSSRRPGHA